MKNYENDPIILEGLYSGAITPSDLDPESELDEAADEEYEDYECDECGSEFCEGECVEEEVEDYDMYPLGIPVPPPTYSFEDAVAKLRDSKIPGNDYMHRPGYNIELQLSECGRYLNAFSNGGPLQYAPYEPTDEDRAATDWGIGSYF